MNDWVLPFILSTFFWLFSFYYLYKSKKVLEQRVEERDRTIEQQTLELRRYLEMNGTRAVEAIIDWAAPTSLRANSEIGAIETIPKEEKKEKVSKYNFINKQ